MKLKFLVIYVLCRAMSNHTHQKELAQKRAKHHFKITRRANPGINSGYLTPSIHAVCKQENNIKKSPQLSQRTNAMPPASCTKQIPRLGAR